MKTIKREWILYLNTLDMVMDVREVS